MKARLCGGIAVLVMMWFWGVAVLYAQPPEIEWSRTYGGVDSDLANSVCATSDGGYVFAGYTKSFTADSNDAYLVKIDSLGNHYWSRLYGGTDYDDAQSVQQTSDGGYILSGRTKSFGAGSNDMYIIKTNDLGDTMWTRTYGGPYSDVSYSVQHTTDEGYILAGRTIRNAGSLSEMYLVKIDSIGDTLWTRSYSGTDNLAAYAVQQTSDGGYIMVGGNPFSGGIEYDIYVVRTNNLGDTLWTRTFGGAGNDYALSVQQTLDGGYILAGWTELSSPNYIDVYIVKIDSLGEIMWTRTYGGYIIAGVTGSFGAENGDMYLVKINTQGDTIWTLVYGGPDYEVVTSMDLTNDGGYIIAGYTYESWVDPADCWLVKTGPDTSSTHAPSIQWVSHPKQFTLHPAYPNPFNPTTTISFDLPVQSHVNLNIYNILGQRIGVLMDRTMPQGIHRVRWDGSDCPSGIYFVRMEAHVYRQVQKIVLLK
jgi:hypothetical protein